MNGLAMWDWVYMTTGVVLTLQVILQGLAVEQGRRRDLMRHPNVQHRHPYQVDVLIALPAVSQLAALPDLLRDLASQQGSCRRLTVHVVATHAEPVQWSAAAREAGLRLRWWTLPPEQVPREVTAFTLQVWGIQRLLASDCGDVVCLLQPTNRLKNGFLDALLQRLRDADVVQPYQAVGPIRQDHWLLRWQETHARLQSRLLLSGRFHARQALPLQGDGLAFRPSILEQFPPRVWAGRSGWQTYGYLLQSLHPVRPAWAPQAVVFAPPLETPQAVVQALADQSVRRHLDGWLWLKQGVRLALRARLLQALAVPLLLWQLSPLYWGALLGLTLNATTPGVGEAVLALFVLANGFTLMTARLPGKDLLRYLILTPLIKLAQAFVFVALLAQRMVGAESASPRRREERSTRLNESLPAVTLPVMHDAGLLTEEQEPVDEPALEANLAAWEAHQPGDQPLSYPDDNTTSAAMGNRREETAQVIQFMRPAADNASSSGREDTATFTTHDEEPEKGASTLVGPPTPPWEYTGPAVLEYGERTVGCLVTTSCRLSPGNSQAAEYAMALQYKGLSFTSGWHGLPLDAYEALAAKLHRRNLTLRVCGGCAYCYQPNDHSPQALCVFDVPEGGEPTAADASGNITLTTPTCPHYEPVFAEEGVEEEEHRADDSTVGASQPQ